MLTGPRQVTEAIANRIYGMHLLLASLIETYHTSCPWLSRECALIVHRLALQEFGIVGKDCEE